LGISFGTRTSTLVDVATAGGGRGLALAMRFSHPTRGAGFLVGLIDPAHLWSPEGLPLPMLDVTVARCGPPPEILHTTTTHPRLQGALSQALLVDRGQGRFEYESPDGVIVTRYWKVLLGPALGPDWIVACHQKRSEVMAPVSAFQATFGAIAAASLLVVAFAASVQIRRSLVPIEVLEAATRRIGVKDFDHRVCIESGDEFEQLGAAFNDMTAKLRRDAEVMQTSNAIGRALTSERTMAPILSRIVDAAATLFQADGCAVYTLGSAGCLAAALVKVRSIGLETARDEDGLGVEVSEIIGLCEAGSINVPDVPADPRFDALRRFGARTGTRAQSTLVIPLRDHEGLVIGALQLIDPVDAHGTVVPFTPETEDLALSIASQAAIAMRNSLLIAEFKNLFDSLIELLATAIDEKSPYTGNHCRRVPILASMIAEEVCRADSGPFADVVLTPQELYELDVAALLHDCGKVTTPVHVVDKATKLETIMDGIDLVDARFDVVSREIEIQDLERRLGAVGDPGPSALAGADGLEERRKLLEADRAFLRECNTGGEFLSEQAKQRIREIADRYRWRVSDGTSRGVLDADQVENLAIARGTLNDRERKIVEDHIVVTMRMLEQLPFPRGLRNVPAIAGAHHERMDGKGYPLGLTRDEISLRGRILGLADVFEALTAKDRPYKRGKTLSESLEILGRMRLEGHIDPDLFDLFIEKRIYERYGRQHLDRTQLDEVDLARIPGVTATQPSPA
jgi:HD-GYP domain-containing protein (c-di-GMP phosphodiesterase class II)/HAMP domain-containing protein